MCGSNYQSGYSQGFGDHHGSYQDRHYGSSGQYDTHSYTSSSRSGGIRSTPSGDDPSKWRWNCCNCSFGNLSYNYNSSCTNCYHSRDSGCKVWSS
ncbi:hypothetical protein F4808DRAFT_459604 [Astrocystis sublimbata]|nr:hypothetical protein F4808DRAFT_459604 [Astrocystis sublimbata]